MKTNNPDMLRLMPAFMKEDPAVGGLAAGSDENIAVLDAMIALVSRWDQIDKLNHAQLDAMAWELNIKWYDSTASLEAKRELVKTSDRVFSTMGTKWAVETMLTALYGPTQIREWWRYLGEPHHFKVLTTNPEVTNGNNERFFEMLELVKRKSQWLDSILVTLTGELYLHTGIALHIRTNETHFIGVNNDTVKLRAVSVDQSVTHETHTITNIEQEA